MQKRSVLQYLISKWPETLVGNRNELAKPNHKDILAKLQTEQIIDDNYQPFGDGNASERIVAAI